MSLLNSTSLHVFLFFSAIHFGQAFSYGETLRHPKSLQDQLKSVSLKYLADQASNRGDAKRGALVFYTSAAACSKCHSVGKSPSPLGPDLTLIAKTNDGKPTSMEHIVESLLYPSKSIRAGYETLSLLDADGKVTNGLLVRENNESYILRDALNLTKEVTINKNDVEAKRVSQKSMMPEGLVATLPDQRSFLDLVKYVFEVATGGTQRSEQLQPDPKSLEVVDDSADLDHAGIIKRLRSRDFETGEKIYHGYCFNCHGRDGNTPSLPTARAFGTQKLKFGADPHSMFMTLTKGNGLMARMSHLTPKERYQVVHYIREAFMKGKNPDYKKVNENYLAGLPKGTQNGTYVEVVQRDYGPALASQLRRKLSSALTLDLNGLSVSYNLNTLDQAEIWSGGFLDLSNTQHARDRGEGTADPIGKKIDGLGGWAWGHGGTLDYSRDELLPRGPMPTHWMHYRGHYLHGDQVILKYLIDGREILEFPKHGPQEKSIRQTIRVGAGDELVLCVAKIDGGKPDKSHPTARISITHPGGGQKTVALVRSRTNLTWEFDPQSRIVIRIPKSDESQTIEITRTVLDESQEFESPVGEIVDPESLTNGGPLRWPDVLPTTGYLGLEQGGYALDTLTIPNSTPWNTWFRTSALDFFSDGRMAVATYGGDVWIVSGVDDALLNLRWKRFAGGLYEPFGLKIVDDIVFVTCKDRLTRLHDLNDDGEADFYESFNADPDVSVNFHAFNFDLQTDAEGNFYYAKSGHGSDSDIPGCVVKISPDGAERSIYCTGFRTPNGMGILPDGRLTTSDNQGQWTPAGKVSLLRPGGFYGWVNNYSIPGMWAPGGGTIDLDKVEAPETFDPPIIWMPQEFDNSSGGQLFVEDPRWGPLSGKLLHTSFGKGWMSYMMMQDFGDVSQAAIIKLPFDFQTGIMRARVNPADGQVYATGLQGWNGGGRAGLLGHGIQRLRYTGTPERVVDQCLVVPDGLRIRFNFELDKLSAQKVGSYVGKQWNYRWQKSYGSDQYSPSTKAKGTDPVVVDSATLSPNLKEVSLVVSNLQPVHQLHLIVRLKDSEGKPFEEEIYWTINRVPKSR